MRYLHTWGQGLASVAALLAVGGLLLLAARTGMAQLDLGRATRAPFDDPHAVLVLQDALAWRPDESDILQALASRMELIDAGAARAYCLRALRANPADWRNWILEGQLEFELGDEGAARRSMLRAAALSRGFEAHFQLGNLARLQGDANLFWEQMRAALAVAPPEDAPFVLQQAQSVAQGDPMALVALMPDTRPEAADQVMGFLSERGDYDAAVAAWNRLRCPPGKLQICGATAVSLANQLLAAGFAAGGTDAARWSAAAVTTWNGAVARLGLGRPRLDPTATVQTLGSEGEGMAFSWSEIKREYVTLAPDHGNAPLAGAFNVHFDGSQADQVILARQLRATVAGEFELSAAGTSLSAPASGGLHLRVFAAPGKLVADLALPLEPNPVRRSVRFTVAPEISILEFELYYERPLGSVRMQGTARVSGIQLHRLSS